MSTYGCCSAAWNWSPAASDQAERGVGERHSLHVDKGQQQRPGGGQTLFTAQHNAGNQRVHRQHARREGNADTNQ
jgi:predicted lipoprotein with Yx(FWY)xxD motif